LRSNVENLILIEGFSIGGSGNDLDNALTGNSAANILSGMGGNDTLLGRDGNDMLSGGPGVDTMIGGDGNDTYDVDNVGDVVTESAGQGFDAVNSTVTYTLSANVENLSLTGSPGIDGTGNALDNQIMGNSAANTLRGDGGDDVLAGNGGADTMIGGTGNETYYVDNVDDVVTESAGQGFDAVNSTVTYTLSANVENLFLTGSAGIDGTGNALNNALNGNAAANALSGGGGRDTLNGGDGNDTLSGGTGNDALNGGSGNDTLVGGAGDDLFVFMANFGSDVISDYQAGINFRFGPTGDALQFDHTLFADDAAVFAHAAQVGSNVVITYDAADTITLLNTSLAALSPDDISFI
jgi:Ca2+-binding RTX toxin-like protein